MRLWPVMSEMMSISCGFEKRGCQVDEGDEVVDGSLSGNLVGPTDG